MFLYHPFDKLVHVSTQKRSMGDILILYIPTMWLFLEFQRQAICRLSKSRTYLSPKLSLYQVREMRQKLGNGSFRPLSRSPWVVSPWVVSPPSRFASITWVVSPSYPESFRPLLDESFRPLSKFIFYWGYCEKITVFVSFKEDVIFCYISLKNDRSFINWSKWYIYMYSV